MHRFIVTKEVEIDYGHRIQLHGSQCSQLHGHRGKILARVSGPLQTEGSSTGMVLDFSDIKMMLMELHKLWDHGMILEKTDPLLLALSAILTNTKDSAHLGLAKLMVFDNAPTAENLASFAFAYLDRRIRGIFIHTNLEDNIILEEVTFYETPTSSATVRRGDIIEDEICQSRQSVSLQQI